MKMMVNVPERSSLKKRPVSGRDIKCDGKVAMGCFIIPIFTPIAETTTAIAELIKIESKRAPFIPLDTRTDVMIKPTQNKIVFSLNPQM